MDIIKMNYVFPQIPFLVGLILSVISIFVTISFVSVNKSWKEPVIAIIVMLLLFAGTYGVTFIHTDEMLYTVEFTDRVPYRELVDAGYSVEEEVVSGQVLKIKGPIGLEDKVLR